MNTLKLCTVCGLPLEGDAPQGLCPQCLLKAGLDTRADSRAPSGATSFVAPAPAELAPHFPKLDILELLGQGGMGAVYKARQKGLDRLVALKILPPSEGRDPAFAERFTREARALARLNHPNIVTIHDFGQAGEYFHLLMEFVDGASLRQSIRARTLQPREALAIIPQICEALQYAHDEGIVHRDVKPENILLDRKGRVKIADFGLAKLLGRSATDYTLTGAQQVMGTPHYMAPEQFEKPLEVDHRADIYALGVVLYEMLTGEVPMGAFSPPSAKARVDVRLDDVVLRTLAREPDRRYQKVSQLKTDVENIAGIVSNLPASVRLSIGFEYKSPRTIFGIPLLHVTSGRDPVTGRKRVAKGIIAIGEVAFGVVAFGGMSAGLFAFGGLALGGLAVGGVAAGALTIGGVSLALLFAYGGLAAGFVAYGGMAAGYYAMGGAAFGVHALGGHSYDPAARQFFRAWSGTLFTVVSLGFILIASLVPGLVTTVIRRRLMREENQGTSRPR